ncbi:MAG: hypothetical protein ACUVQG_04280 [Thermogutta sp.]
MVSFQRYIELLQQGIGELGPKEWGVFVALMLVVGFICLRGLGVNRGY